MFFPVILALAPFAAAASPLDDQACLRLRTERQALTVLGIDKHVEKGAGWAKERLTVADLDLVKRYLDVFEQLKFRCDKLVALVEPEEKDDDDDDDKAVSGGALPPLPERRSLQPMKSSAEPAASPATKSNTAAKSGKATFGATNASAAQMAPARIVPAR
jgi:hypothetical protein